MPRASRACQSEVRAQRDHPGWKTTCERKGTAVTAEGLAAAGRRSPVPRLRIAKLRRGKGRRALPGGANKYAVFVMPAVAFTAEPRFLARDVHIRQAVGRNSA